MASEWRVTPAQRNYVSKINFYSWAVNENIVVVFHEGIAIGSKVSVYFQWTKDAGGTEKKNQHYNGDIWSLEQKDDGYLIKFVKDYYYFTGFISDTKFTVTMKTTDPAHNQQSNEMTFAQAYP